MPKRSKEVDDLYALRDLIADGIIDYQKKHPGRRVVIYSEHDNVTEGMAQIGMISVEAVAKDGSHKATSFRSLSER